MAADKFSTNMYAMNFPATSAAAITPHDDNDLTQVSRALYVGGAGNVTVIMADGQTVTFFSVPAGSLLPVRVARHKSGRDNGNQYLGGVVMIGIGIGIPDLSRGAGGGVYEFAAGSLAGEIERLTASGDYTLTVDGHNLPVQYIQIDGDQTYSTNTNLGSATPDTRMVCVKVKGNLTVNSGVTVTTTDRKLGLVFYVTGNVQIDDTIDMTARGANHSATGSNLAEFALQVIAGIGANGVVPSAGGAGGPQQANSASGNNGSAGSTGGTGGGGSGAASSSGTGGRGGAGAAGTLWSGGTGGGGGNSSGGVAGAIRGGAGGNGAGALANSGGAGNPGGTSTGGEVPGHNGTGGLLIIICLAAITVGATGLVRANGSNGGGTPGGGTSHGGGGGGGSVNLYRRGAYTNSGTVQASGGIGINTGLRKGGDGGAGSVRSVAI